MTPVFPTRFRVLAVLVCVGALLAAPGTLYASVCAGEDRPPVTITFMTPMDGIQSGSALDLAGEVWLEADVDDLVLRFETLGSAVYRGPAVLPLGPRAAGEVVPFSIPVSYRGQGRSAVQVTAEVADKAGTPLFSVREGVYTLIRPTGSVSGNGGFVALDQIAVEEDIANGRIAGEAIEAARTEVITMPGVESDADLPVRFFTPQEQGLNALVDAPPQGYISVSREPQSPGADITIQGNISWTDENGVTHPAYGANVQIWDEDLFVDEFLTVVATDANGNYVAVVDDDDGPLQGDRDIYVRLITANTWVDTQTLSGDTYEATSGVWDETPGGTVLNWSFTAANTGTGPAMSVFQAGTWIAAYVAFDAEPAAFGSVDIVWPNGDTGSFYDGQVKMEEEDRWDWDTTQHEYGHYAMDVLSIDANPGGAHSSADCAVDERSNKSEGLRLAWGESWPTFFALSSQAELGLASLGVPRVGDVSYQDFEDGTLQYSLEVEDNNGRGEDNERAIMRLLWDVYDTADDARDEMSLGDNAMWDAIKAAAGSPHILSRYWNSGIRSGQTNQTQLALGGIAADQQIGPTLNAPAAAAIVSPSSRTFSWDRRVGCPSSYSGDSFDLVFYNASTYAKILTKAGLTGTSHVLSLADLSTLIASTHDVIWAVEGYHLGTAPATGPYLGESFQIVVNTPPVADAGEDITAECTSPTTTPVQLDGTGSSDPDGDPLTYAWAATGITFDNAASATPTGEFPKGTTVVTLTVSDGIEEDTDTVEVTVEDTTPPDITCPVDITVECSEHGGTPADHPDLDPFWAGVSATDICDTDPVIDDNAPAFFDLGTTTVTFYATDECGNVDSCMAVVTVEDTTPPEIEVTLNRDALWPPNHKMVDIEASVWVFDICDPNPPFVLTSITSDEPDDDIGDGHTVGDIAEADTATADTTFSLRAERQGGGDGRKYTIIYTATDCSDNSASDTVCVTVPHDQSGNASSLSGFIVDGTRIEPGASTVEFVLRLADDVDAMEMDPRRTYVGNHIGALRPVAWAVRDITGDDIPDFLVEYDAAAVEDLRRISKKKYPLGIHYVTPDGTDYLVPDILQLGLALVPILVEPRDDTQEGGDLPTQDGIGFDERDPEVETGIHGPGVLALSRGGFVMAEVFDVTGRKVRTLVQDHLGAGTHDLRWDGRFDSGRAAPSGIYFYRILSPEARQVHKILITR